MKKKWLAIINQALDALLNLDADAKQRLLLLQDKVVTITLTPFNITFQMVMTEKGIELQTGELLTADVKICGTPLQMMGVLLDQNNRSRFFADDVIMEGDAVLGQQIITIIDSMDIDWEGLLSNWVGDVPSYHVGRYIRNIKSCFAQSKDSLVQNMNEFIHEEAQWLPAREALQDFFNDIDLLRMELDRLEAHINQLQFCMHINEKNHHMPNEEIS